MLEIDKCKHTNLAVSLVISGEMSCEVTVCRTVNESYSYSSRLNTGW